MTKLNRVVLFLTPALWVLGGCSHTELQKRIDDKVGQEASVTNSTELRLETNKVIETTPGITDAQKSALLALSKSTRAQLDALRGNSVKLRSVLIQDLVAEKYDEDEVEMIKDRLRNTEDKRVSVLFDAVHQANVILGRDARVHSGVIHAFIDGRDQSRAD